MTKEIVKARIRIKETYGSKVTLATLETYGALIDSRTIRAEGYTFHAGRKSGFGKSAYIYERINGIHCTVIIDRIEKVA